MSIFPSNGEVFGANVLYGVIVALSAFTLFAAVAATTPGQPPVQHVTASAPQVVESVVVTAERVNHS